MRPRGLGPTAEGLHAGRRVWSEQHSDVLRFRGCLSEGAVGIYSLRFLFFSVLFLRWKKGGQTAGSGHRLVPFFDEGVTHVVRGWAVFTVMSTCSHAAVGSTPAAL